MVETIAPDRQLLTIAATAETLSISETTVRRLIGAGILPAVRVSAGAIRVERDTLAEWLDERRTASSAVGDSSANAVGRSSVDAPMAHRPGPVSAGQSNPDVSRRGKP